MTGLKRQFINRLNDLDPKSWLKFQKSWFVHNPPRRSKDVLRHPAKFPETLAQEFIDFFTKPGQVVLDPMAGTGSTLVAALRSGRHAYGIELNPQYAEIAKQFISAERSALAAATQESRYPGTNDRQSGAAAGDRDPKIVVITGDAAHFAYLAHEYQMPPIDYVLTSPPYWDMLHARGAATQRKRRAAQDLDVIYSTDPADLGNIQDFDQFLNQLVEIYSGLKPFLREKAYLTIIVKNVKKGGKIYPLAWELARLLGSTYALKDERIWCQDDIRLAPYGLGNAWVSNTFHHYCLQFRNE